MDSFTAIIEIANTLKVETARLEVLSRKRALRLKKSFEKRMSVAKKYDLLKKQALARAADKYERLKEKALAAIPAEEDNMLKQIRQIEEGIRLGQLRLRELSANPKSETPEQRVKIIQTIVTEDGPKEIVGERAL